jgi:hypothetical protein
VCFALQPGPTACIANCFRRPFAAVCHRHNFDLDVPRPIAQSFRDILRDLARIERAFKFIWGNQDFHGYNFIARQALVI